MNELFDTFLNVYHAVVVISIIYDISSTERASKLRKTLLEKLIGKWRK